MKKMGIAVAMVSWMATGAFAASTAQQAQAKSTAQQAQAKPTLAQTQAMKIAMLKKKRKKQVDMTTTSRGAPQPLTKRREQQDAVKATSSSAVSAAAVSPITAGTSVTEAQTVGAKKRFIDNVRAGIVEEFYGPSVADPLSGRMPDLAKGYSESDSALNFLHHVTAGYQVSDNITLTLDPYFQTIGQSADGKEHGTLIRFREDYSYFNVKFKKIIKTKRFTYNGGVRFYPGFGERNVGRPLYIRHDMNLVYALTPRMNLAMYNTVRAYDRTSAYYDATEVDDKGQVTHPNADAFDLRATVGPTVEYQIADSLGSYLSYVVDVRHAKNSGKIIDAPIDEAPYFELGGSWDIMKKVNLNPYIDAYANTPNIEAWQLGANLAISFL